MGAEHAGEVLGILESETVGHLRYRLPGQHPGLGFLHHKLPDVLSGILAGEPLHHITEIIGRHAEMSGACLHRRKPLLLLTAAVVPML